MPESVPEGSSPGVGVPQRLKEISRLLREVRYLGPEAQRELAELADELGSALGSTAVPSPEAAHLADSTAHLIETLHREEEGSNLTAARDRVERAVLGAAARSPLLAGLARRLLDALANLGI
jgi:hypothetical protein